MQLRAQGYEIDEMRVADHVQLASNGLITNEVTIAEDPDLVRRMVAAFLHGLEDAIRDPGEAYELCQAHVPNLAEADESVQKQVLARSIELWQADGPLGTSDAQAWENMQDTLLQMGLLEEPLELEKAFTNEFLP